MSDLDLTPFFTTKAEAGDFYNRLSSVSEKCYQTGFDLEKYLIEELGIQKKEKFMLLINDNKIQIKSNSALKALITKVLENITATPVVSLTLAFEPLENTLNDIVQWFMLNTNKQVILDLTIDRSLIAGASIQYKGKFNDFSIRPLFDQIVNKNLSIPKQSVANIKIEVPLPEQVSMPAKTQIKEETAPLPEQV